MHAAEMQRQAVSLGQAESAQRSNGSSYQASPPYRHSASGSGSYSTIFGQAGVACWRWGGKIWIRKTEGIWKLIPKWCLMFILMAFSVIFWALEILIALLGAFVRGFAGR